MRRLLGIVALGMAFSIPAHAQGGTGSNARTFSGGATASGGGSASSHPSYTPTAQFQTTVASGSSGEYVPSSYLPFDQAVALALKPLIPAKPANIVEVAQEYRSAKGQSSDHVIVQDLNGDFVEESR